jgi:UPF0755 protein
VKPSKRIVLVVAAALLALAGIAVARVVAERVLSAPGPHAAVVRVKVRTGESLRSVLGSLATSGALEQPRMVEAALRLAGREARVRAGTYDLPARASPGDILAQMEEGRVVLESLTVVEGWRFRDLRRALEAHPAVRATQRGRSDGELMASLGAAGQHPEGLFFPDTYRFAEGTTDLELLALARRRMQAELSAAWAARAPELPLRSPYEALILASIVEKETGLAAERARIAGVFVARLRRGMRLQTDPTVIYGLGDGYDGDIRSRDLVTDTPYNTYTRSGLTPTPIALPGRAALRAATRPQETGELFFVATGIGDGSHVFSTTYDQHRAAVARMLARQRGQAGGAK